MLDILIDLGGWLIYGLSASIFRLLKGRKTKLKDEIENHKLRNAITSIIIFILLVIIIIMLKN